MRPALNPQALNSRESPRLFGQELQEHVKCRIVGDVAVHRRLPDLLKPLADAAARALLLARAPTNHRPTNLGT